MDAGAADDPAATSSAETSGGPASATSTQPATRPGRPPRRSFSRRNPEPVDPAPVDPSHAAEPGAEAPAPPSSDPPAEGPPADFQSEGLAALLGAAGQDILDAFGIGETDDSGPDADDSGAGQAPGGGEDWRTIFERHFDEFEQNARAQARLSREAAEQEAELLGEDLVRELPEGADSRQVTEVVSRALAFLKRRLTGDYEIDDYGFDPELTDAILLALLRPLYRKWFRVEVRGIENVPSAGGALVVANHSGTIALDALMTQVALRDEHPAHRQLRLLGADLVFRTPVVGELARKSGSTLASNADAEALLRDGHVVGVFPEGFKGIGKPFTERYKLQRFGRGGFVSAALRTQTPIVPCAIVGAEEIYPIIARSGTAARLLNLPYAPITPTWPLLGPLGLIPLPSKWFIEFGEPIWTTELDPSGADDPMLLFDLTDRVRETIQQNLYSLLMQRRSVFF